MPLRLDSIEVVGGQVLLSTDAQSPVPVDLVLRGADMQFVDAVALNSGEGVAWVVSTISAGATSVLVTAYAYGTTPGTGFIGATVANEIALLNEIGFALPLLD